MRVMSTMNVRKGLQQLPLILSRRRSPPIIAIIIAGVKKPSAVRLSSRKMSSSSASPPSSSLPSSVSRDNNNNHDDNNGPKESTIRKMTRLAIEYGAINLSQGFPNEGPPWELRLALAHGVLSGQPEMAAAAAATAAATAAPPTTSSSSSDGDDEDRHHVKHVEQLKKSIIEMVQSESSSSDSAHHQQHRLDQLNQYSPPMGRLDLRQGISNYYQRFYQYSIPPDDITVTLGATEAFASALRTIGRPGDKCVILEPFHELYPSQCQIFYLEPVYVTLRVSSTSSSGAANGNQQYCWELNFDELEQALQGAKILMLNSPHNPTGKVFTRLELQKIVELCLKNDVYILTDEIYEHMVYDNNNKHYLIPREFPEIAHRTLVCNSLGKSASATGWRLGWCLHPPHVRDAYRGIHDQMCVMSPHPMQYATLSYLTLPDSYFYNLKNRYQRRVTQLAHALTRVGFQVVFPQGAYYLFVNYRQVPALAKMDSSMQAAMFLLQTIGVASVPGENFYHDSSSEKNNPGNDYLRFAACRSDSDLEEASIRLSKLNEMK